MPPFWYVLLTLMYLNPLHPKTNQLFHQRLTLLTSLKPLLHLWLDCATAAPRHQWHTGTHSGPLLGPFAVRSHGQTRHFEHTSAAALKRSHITIKSLFSCFEAAKSVNGDGGVSDFVFYYTFRDRCCFSTEPKANVLWPMLQWIRLRLYNYYAIYPYFISLHK